MIDLVLDQFLVIITEREPAARFPCGNMAYQVTQVDFLPFRDKSNDDVDMTNKLNGIKNLLETQGFYYSYYVDLTSNQQK